MESKGRSDRLLNPLIPIDRPGAHHPAVYFFDIFAIAIAATHKPLAAKRKIACDIMALAVGAP
ncbi:hypothetical protein ACXHXG_01750 [Rhizobium sp. LEGMi198b]|uniref:hypothetical protein n=1 Tax=Rhizobium sp. CB3171 TaxID=3039157 RepID=UPI0024B232FB|nr:hypothetical protein [Rhizobium sp. CB3171]WFU02889.1 hypothetical protein QA648_03665 [Rhizobium sp. CB3171]